MQTNQLLDRRGNPVNIGDRVLTCDNFSGLVEAIFYKETDKSWLFKWDILDYRIQISKRIYPPWNPCKQIHKL